MNHNEFQIGIEFRCGNRLWRCTDVGTRTVIAICLDEHDASWHRGPPYAVVETVFDEDDFQGCSLAISLEEEIPVPLDTPKPKFGTLRGKVAPTKESLLCAMSDQDADDFIDGGDSNPRNAKLDRITPHQTTNPAMTEEQRQTAERELKTEILAEMESEWSELDLQPGDPVVSRENDEEANGPDHLDHGHR